MLSVLQEFLAASMSVGNIQKVAFRISYVPYTLQIFFHYLLRMRITETQRSFCDLLKVTQTDYRAEIHIQAYLHSKAFFPPASCLSCGNILQNGTLDPQNKVPDPVKELPQLG